MESLTDEDRQTLAARFSPATVSPNFEPGQKVKRFLAAIWHSQDGRETIEWLMDITLRAPYPVTPQTSEDLAFAAAKHQARAAVGMVIVNAAQGGFELLKHKEEQPHDNSA